MNHNPVKRRLARQTCRLSCQIVPAVCSQNAVYQIYNDLGT